MSRGHAARPIRYAPLDESMIAYCTFGDGPLDIVALAGPANHLEHLWREPTVAAWLTGLGALGRVVMFDRRGTGLSDPPPGDPTLEQHVDEMLAVMDAVGVQRAALIGFNEAGRVCALAAATHPERASHLILCGCSASGAGGLMPDSADTLLAFVESAYGEGRILALYAPSLAGDEHFSAWFSELERASVSPAMARKLIELYLRTDVGPILGAIRAPTLVVHRRDDTHIPIAKGRELAAQIPGAQLVELEGRDNLVVAGDGRAVLDEFGRFLLGKRRPVEADRVLATVLFVDIVGSTERAAAMGDRKWMSVLTLYHRRALAEIEAHGGHLVRSLGDGTLATFDCPARAIGAARAIRAAAAALGLRVRAGLHTGEIELTGDDVGGIGVHLAARVLDAAAPDQILTSQTVKDLVFGSGLRFTARGGHELRGIPGTWQLYAVADAIVATVA